MSACAGGFADAGLGLEEIGVFIGACDGGGGLVMCAGEGEGEVGDERTCS